jgi:hypothetical protein
MFHSTNQPGQASEGTASTHGDRPESSPPFPAWSPSGAGLPGVDLRSLPNGTQVVVDTRNSRYRLVMLEEHGCKALVQGGRYFGRETEVDVHGSALAGCPVDDGWVGLGLSLELSLRGKRILTSRVRSIAVEPHAALVKRDPQLAETARRIAREFRNLPGMRLTKSQVGRLWTLSSHQCETVLERLVGSHVIACDETGRYGLRA